MPSNDTQNESHHINIIDVVVPCYKAAEWIDDFIEAMLSVVEINWRLVIRDDGSQDSSLEKLLAWKVRLGGRLLLLDENNPVNLGLIGNYNAVLTASSSAWVFTADPDDVWLPDHVPLIIKSIQRAESSHGIDQPMAIGTDGRVVDAQLNTISSSYWKWSRIIPVENPPVRKIAMESAALGSTMAINRALINKALPLPQGAAYQDWWLAMVASAFGQFILISHPTILYRRHGINATTSPYSTSIGRGLLRLLFAPAEAHRRLVFLISQAAVQAAAFQSRYFHYLSPKDNEALIALSSIRNFGFFNRRLIIVKYGLWFGSLLKNAGLMLLI